MGLRAAVDRAQADEAGSWTSKYLRGSEGLRDVVNTLLELAFLAPHRWAAAHSSRTRQGLRSCEV